MWREPGGKVLPFAWVVVKVILKEEILELGCEA